MDFEINIHDLNKTVLPGNLKIKKQYVVVITCDRKIAMRINQINNNMP